MARGQTIREALPSELPAVESALRSAGFSSQVGPLLSLPLASPHGVILLAEGSHGIDGVSAALGYPNSRSGWLGAIGVRPQMRRRGIARALTESSIDWLRSRGAETVSLYATDSGRPLYEQFGFEAEDRTTAWRGSARAYAAPGITVRALRPEEDRPAIVELDRAATGEDRGPVLEEIDPVDGWMAIGADGSRLGFALKTGWSTAVPVIAASPEAGVSLMGAVASQPGGGTLIVPEGNRAASEAVRAWHLGRLNDALRMRLGPPLDRIASRQFATFNLFWG